MTDREMLELAAKAAGYGEVWYSGGYSYIGPKPKLGKDLEYRTFDPLTDDGDAFRLMVKLGLDVETHGGKTMHSYAGAFDCSRNIAFEVQPEDGDICAATRRVITLVAAEIGRNMP